MLRKLLKKGYEKLGLINYFLFFYRKCKMGKNVTIYPTAFLDNKGKPSQVVIGKNCRIKGRLVCQKKGRIDIGEHTYIGHHANINSFNWINIGPYCLIAHYVEIWDSDSHPTNPLLRMAHIEDSFKDYYKGEIKSSRISIGCNAWLGMHSIILKGAIIEPNKIVGAGEVIRK